MELLLDRGRVVKDATVGFFCVNGQFECYVLEDMVREVEGQPVASWKVPGKTAIPAGRYRVTLEASPRFGPNTLTIHDVPGFTGVRIHGGNSAADTEGCPLLGDGLAGARISAGTSAMAVNRVKVAVARARDAGEAVWLTITNP